MDSIYFLMDLVAQLPELLVVLICPAILLICGVIFALLDCKKAYFPVAIGLGGLAFFLTASIDLSSSFAYMGLYLVWTVLVNLLFLIHPREKKESTQEELFRTFYRPLDLGEEREETESATLDREESELRLSHTLELLEKLKKSDLSAGDRLEADALSRTLDGLSDKQLTESEMRSLNDCLATILKLTAKYNL